jgi:hypothetical protein
MFYWTFFFSFLFWAATSFSNGGIIYLSCFASPRAKVKSGYANSLFSTPIPVLFIAIVGLFLAQWFLPSWVVLVAFSFASYLIEFNLQLLLIIKRYLKNRLEKCSKLSKKEKKFCKLNILLIRKNYKSFVYLSGGTLCILKFCLIAINLYLIVQMVFCITVYLVLQNIWKKKKLKFFILEKNIKLIILYDFW